MAENLSVTDQGYCVASDHIQNEDDYDRLPFVIQSLYSRKEWLWLSDVEKANLCQTECEPESFDE